MNNTNDKYILYILVRNDLPSLNPGKAMAQAIHAAHVFVKLCGKMKQYKAWEGDQGFGTTITLSADLRTIEKLTNSVLYPTGAWVVDPTYPCMVPADVLKLVDVKRLTDRPKFTDDGSQVVLYREEKTCAYLFGEKEVLAQWVADLPTYS